MIYNNSLKIFPPKIYLTKVLFKPDLNIFIVFLSIILSPFISIGPFQPWQICSVLILLLNFNIKFVNIKPFLNFIPLFLYTLINLLVSLYFVDNKFDTINKFALFSSVYIVFLVLIISGEKYSSNEKLFIRTLNTIVLIVTIYGIYQFIGRQLDWPFTFDESLRFRKFKVAGFYQASSFFEEPAFFSQFLITGLFIQLFILRFKYKLIVLLLSFNVLFTLSVTGILSFFIILGAYFLTTVPLKLTLTTSRQKIKKILLISSSLLLIFLFVLDSQIPSYVKGRIKRSFVSDSQREYLEVQSKLKGIGIAYDVSGYLRVTNELKTFNQVLLSKNVLWGYGINYQDSLPERKMALNAITEIMVRWGLIGLFLFLTPIFNVINRSPNKFSTILFFVLLFFIDGAIAKLVFWFLIALLLIGIDLFKSPKDVVYNRTSSQ